MAHRKCTLPGHGAVVKTSQRISDDMFAARTARAERRSGRARHVMLGLEEAEARTLRFHTLGRFPYIIIYDNLRE